MPDYDLVSSTHHVCDLAEEADWLLLLHRRVMPAHNTCVHRDIWILRIFNQTLYAGWYSFGKGSSHPLTIHIIGIHVLMSVDFYYAMSYRAAMHTGRAHGLHEWYIYVCKA